MTDDAPHLSSEQVTEVLSLIAGSDSVELKLTVPESGHRSAVTSLGLDPLEAQIRQVAFFDTPDLTLNGCGVVVRARRVQGKGGDAVVKLRPVVPDDLPGKIRKAPSFGVEVDAMPGGFVCSGSMSAQLDAATAKAGFAGAVPLRKLLSKEQRGFYERFAPKGLSLGALSLLGPITILKLKFAPEDFTQRMVAELWFYPDGSRILELSTKCPPAQAFEVAAATRGYLDRHGISLSGEQSTKTRSALEFFAGELQAAGAG